MKTRRELFGLFAAAPVVVHAFTLAPVDTSGGPRCDNACRETFICPVHKTKGERFTFEVANERDAHALTAILERAGWSTPSPWPYAMVSMPSGQPTGRWIVPIVVPPETATA